MTPADRPATFEEWVEQAARALPGSSLWWEGADEDASTNVRHRRDEARRMARATLTAAGVPELEATLRTSQEVELILLARLDTAEAEVKRWKARWRATVDDAGGYMAERDAALDGLSRARAEGWDAAVDAMVYEDGTPVEVVHSANPYRAALIPTEGTDR